MKKLMILGASILQLPAIKKAKEMGLSVIAVDMDPNAIGFHEEGIEIEVISTIDIPAVVEAAKRHNIDGIMTLASDLPMRTVAKVSQDMGLIGITEETALKATNKAIMRQAFSDFDVPIPLFYEVLNESQFYEAVNKIREKGYKVIIKPSDNSGSRGVKLLNNYSRDYLAEAYKYTKNYSHSGSIVVEEFMEGPEVSVETLTIDGICHIIQITDKLTTGAPYFVEMGHSQPSQQSAKVKEEIEKVAIAANKAVGITNGPSHTEIKITKEGPKVVELGARLGGDNITTHLVPLSTGINMVEYCIKIALGEHVDITNKLEKGSAIRYFNSSPGILKNIVGIENAKKIDGVKQISMVYNIGDSIGEIKSSSDRIGFVIAQGEDALDAIKKCEKAINLIDVRID